MLTKDDYTIINIKQYLDLIDKNIIREDEFNKLLSDFLCPKNKDVELFLKSKAIEFTRKDSSVTYLVFSNEDSITPVGYFCIALKPLTIKGKILSSKKRKQIKNISEYDEDTDSYKMSAYLIAQLAKNFANKQNEKITGGVLLELALSVIEEIQFMGGGRVVFLETINNEKLINFYKNNCFNNFGSRQSTSTNTESYELIQLFKVL